VDNEIKLSVATLMEKINSLNELKNRGVATLEKKINELEEKITKLKTKRKELRNRDTKLQTLNADLERRNEDRRNDLHEYLLRFTATPGGDSSSHHYRGMLRDQPQHAFRLGPTAEE
jgi:DNA repair exonuclease SbcCD ATPase subunit